MCSIYMISICFMHSGSAVCTVCFCFHFRVIAFASKNFELQPPLSRKVVILLLRQATAVARFLSETV